MQKFQREKAPAGKRQTISFLNLDTAASAEAYSIIIFEELATLLFENIEIEKSNLFVEESGVKISLLFFVVNPEHPISHFILVITS